MEENYLLAKSVVDEKFNKNNEYYYMFICALFGFFMKYPDHKELIINSFKDTNIIIEDISVLDIQKKYDLNLIKDDELAVQDPKACINHGASDIGIGYFIQDKELQMIQDNPTIICSGKDNSPANLINIFVHELNHIIKSFYNSIIIAFLVKVRLHVVYKVLFGKHVCKRCRYSLGYDYSVITFVWA